MSSATTRWRERLESGMYRQHGAGCRSSVDRKPGRRCTCPIEFKAPGPRPGSTRTVTFHGTISEARAERHRLRAAGRQVIDTADQTLHQLAVDYLRAKAPHLAPSTIARRASSYRLYVAPHLGALELHRVTRERLELWLADLLAAGVSADACKRALEVVRVALAAGVEWGRLRANPARGLRPPKAPTCDPVAARVLTPEQLDRLFAATRRPHLETMLRMAGEAGLRLGEIIGLRWGDVDLAGRRVTVARAVWQESGRNGAPPTKHIKPPKGRRARKVAISRALAARLADWYERSVIRDGRDATGWVWPGRDGGPMDDSTPGQALARVMRRAGLVDDDGRPLVTFHGLRHTAASIMLAHGVPLIVVSRQLGHADPNVTARVYAHLLSDAQLDLAAGAFDRAADTVAETVAEPPAPDENRMPKRVSAERRPDF